MSKPVRILLVEDDQDDIYFFRYYLDHEERSYQLEVITQGDQVLTTTFAPDVIVLDLKLPRISGHELLPLIKCHPLLGSVPVVVMSTTNATNEIMQVMNDGASTYLLKPVTVIGFQKMIQTVFHHATQYTNSNSNHYANQEEHNQKPGDETVGQQDFAQNDAGQVEVPKWETGQITVRANSGQGSGQISHDFIQPVRRREGAFGSPVCTDGQTHEVSDGNPHRMV